jgi:uncharacterized protein (TIRG00374 family)
LARYLFTKRSRQALITGAISAALVALLFASIDWREAVRVFGDRFSVWTLVPFSVIAFSIAAGFGCRWNLLVGKKLSWKTSLFAAAISLGGNMFLPARGGELLRVHYSHLVTEMSHAHLLGRLFVEKIIDLVCLAAVGVVAVTLLFQFDVLSSSAFTTLVPVAGIAFGAALFLVVVLKYFGEVLLRLGHPVFALIGKSEFFERHAQNLVRDAGLALTARKMMLPAGVTLVMWLSMYTPCYILIARSVGVALDYREALLVVFAGALGVMVPAAPSGLGTFHASVVSAFMVLGRSPTDGLLVATTIHLLFFVAYAVPAAWLYGRWRFRHDVPR